MCNYASVKTFTTEEPPTPGLGQRGDLPVMSNAAARYALNAVCLGFFLVVLDTTALNVAIAAIQRDFHGTVTGLQWVVNSYTMVFASLMLTCGAVGDRFGAKRFYQIGLALFTGMSCLCALAPGVNWLIALRILQGLGAAIMLPASLALLSQAFPNPDERSQAVTYWATIVSLGFAAGPVLGGALTHYLGWRAIFWLNVPFGLAALLMVRAFVKDSSTINTRPIDWVGQILAVSALFCLTYALIEAGSLGWTAPRILAAFGASFLLTVLFFLAEKASASPVLPAFLFANSTFSICVASGAVLNFGVYGTLFIESIYLQNIRQLNSLMAGMVILPLTVVPALASRFLIKYARSRHIKGRLIAGQVIAGLGAAVLMLALRDTGYAEILAGLGLIGAGLGCVMPAITAGVLASSPTHTSGVASGILNSARQVGGTLGVALMGSLFQTRQMQGLVLCFALVVVGSALMAAITAKSMPSPGAGRR